MSDLITLKIDDRTIDSHLARLIAKGGNLRPVMREISHDMRDAVLENVEREGRPSPWKKSRRAAKQGGKTLQHTRRLMKSITPASSSDAASVGTNLVYAAIHHFGGPIRFKGRERIMNFKQVRRGKMTFSRPGQGDRFAKAGKAHYSMKVSGKAYSVEMPARPYMLLHEDDLNKISETDAPISGGRQLTGVP